MEEFMNGRDVEDAAHPYISEFSTIPDAWEVSLAHVSQRRFPRKQDCKDFSQLELQASEYYSLLHPQAPLIKLASFLYRARGMEDTEPVLHRWTLRSPWHTVLSPSFPPSSLSLFSFPSSFLLSLPLPFLSFLPFFLPINIYWDLLICQLLFRLPGIE